MPRADRVTLDIATLDDEGRGVGAHAGAALHVAGALPGDRVVADIEHRSPHRAEAWARLVTIERPAPTRTTPVCAATGRCGGCALGALDYAAQRAYKTARLGAALAGVPGAPTEIVLAPSPRSTGYRSFAKLVYGLQRGAPVLGAYAPRSHQLVDLAGCGVTEPVLEAVRAAVLAVLRARQIAPHDERTGQGDLAYVALRSNARGQVLVTLVGATLAPLVALAPAVAAAHEAVVGVAANQRPRGNAIFGDETRVAHGAAELEEHVGPVTLLLSPTAFFQVNRDVAARIYDDLATAIAPDVDGAVVDAYAGVGGIALTLAARGVREVVGIEVNAAAVRDATRAAASTGADVRFVVDDAARGLDARAGATDVVVVNPPRRGLDDAMIDALRRARPRRVAYVSCDPATLARDALALAAQGLALESVRGYDMHPHTPHIEALALLRRGS